MRRASPMNQSSQDVGSAYCSIEHPIRAVIEDKSTDGATGGRRARPATFSRYCRWLRHGRNVVIAIPAATGNGNEPTIKAACQAATSNEPTYKADCQKTSKSVRPFHAHGCLFIHIHDGSLPEQNLACLENQACLIPHLEPHPTAQEASGKADGLVVLALLFLEKLNAVGHVYEDVHEGLGLSPRELRIASYLSHQFA